VQNGNTLTIRWAPGHADIEGNEVADKQANRVAQNLAAAVRYEPNIMKFTSISHLRRRAKEARSTGCKEWIEHCRGRKSYLRPHKDGIRKELKKERKGIATRHVQLLTGHAIIAPFLKEKLKKIDSDECWWSDKRGRQTRDHLFKGCDRWKRQTQRLWTDVGRKLEWRSPKAKPMSRLFREERVTKVILQFLKDTDIGKFSTDIPL
jgi:hypothetical protein